MSQDQSLEAQGAEPEPCKHGHLHYCGTCRVEAAPKCKHGNPFYCGFCFRETGDGRVK